METGVNISFKIPIWLDRICAWPVMEYRKHKYGYSFRRIYLGEGQWTIVDVDVYYQLGQFKWSAVGNDKKNYAVRVLRKTEFGRIKPMYLHREIMNPPEGLLVDHRNRDSLDNLRSNLRIATSAENVRNRQKTTRKTSSQFRGVSFNKNRQKWTAHIQYNGKTIFLGRFTSEVEAARVYDRAAIKYHGEFACLNFTE